MERTIYRPPTSQSGRRRRLVRERWVRPVTLRPKRRLIRSISVSAASPLSEVKKTPLIEAPLIKQDEAIAHGGAMHEAVHSRGDPCGRPGGDGYPGGDGRPGEDGCPGSPAPD